MTSYESFFGNYLKVDSLKGEMVVTIKEIRVDTVESEEGSEQKLVAYFNELDKALVVNRTNADSIAELAGSKEIELWKGLVICLFVDPKVMFGSKKTGGIRVKAMPSEKTELVSVKILQTVPAFVGADMNEHGPFSVGEVVVVPAQIASLLLARKLAEKPIVMV